MRSFWPAIIALAMSCGVSTRASAQTDDAVTAATDAKLRELNDEGIKHMAAKSYEKAYAAFLTAWRLRPQYQIAGNLASAEFALQRYRDAAEHASYFLREAPETGTAERRAQRAQERQRAHALLDQVRPRLGMVNVEVVPPGADVLVNRALVGKAPLPGPVFVDPGRYEVEAKVEGRPPVGRDGDILAGNSATVRLEVLESPPAADYPRPVAPVLIPSSASPAEGTPTRTIVALTAAALTVVSGGIATGYYLSAVSANRDVNSASARTAAMGTSCSVMMTADCTQLSDAVDRRSSARTVAIGAGIATAVFAGSTAATLLLWRPPASDHSTQTRFVALPLASGGMWLGMAGSL